MPQRGTDADSRIFFDELVSLDAARLRATGVIKLEDRQVVVRFSQQNKLVGVSHTVFKNSGSWSYFVCPKCGRRAKRLWLVNDAPRCRSCCWSSGARYRSAYGFGRTERLRERDRRVDKLQAMLEGGRLRIKPPPPNWGDRLIDRRHRLTWALRRARIATRLAQIAHQEQQNSESHDQLPLLHAYKPRADAVETIQNVQSLWRAKSIKELEIALDKAQTILVRALQSDDFRTQLKAAKLMLRTREARQRGW